MKGEDERQHLEFIQNIITRMNTNSFQIKGWHITIASAIFAIFATTKNKYFLLIAIFSSVIFWFLDAYYLLQERKFRGLYNDVAGISSKPENIKTYEMRPDLYTKSKNKKYSFCNVFWSTTIWKLYSIVIILTVVIYLYLQFI